MTIQIQSSELDAVVAAAKAEIEGVSVLREAAEEVVISGEKAVKGLDALIEESRPRIKRILKLAEVLVSVAIATVMVLGITAMIVLIF